MFCRHRLGPFALWYDLDLGFIDFFCLNDLSIGDMGVLPCFLFLPWFLTDLSPLQLVYWCSCSSFSQLLGRVSSIPLASVPCLGLSFYVLVFDLLRWITSDFKVRVLWVWWYTLIVPATPGSEAGESLDSRGSRPAWATGQNPFQKKKIK
jgi:hypothetical protein